MRLFALFEDPAFCPKHTQQNCDKAKMLIWEARSSELQILHFPGKALAKTDVFQLFTIFPNIVVKSKDIPLSVDFFGNVGIRMVDLIGLNL